MTVQYITNEDGAVVAQFDGGLREPKSDHEHHTVDSTDDLPGVDEWDDDYLNL